MLDEAAASPGRAPVERRGRLSAAALEVISEKVGAAYSPVVITGLVRLADFVMLSLVGLGVYLLYVARVDGFGWDYPVAILTTGERLGISRRRWRGVRRELQAQRLELA